MKQAAAVRVRGGRYVTVSSVHHRSIYPRTRMLSPSGGADSWTLSLATPTCRCRTTDDSLHPPSPPPPLHTADDDHFPRRLVN